MIHFANDGDNACIISQFSILKNKNRNNEEG